MISAKMRRTGHSSYSIIRDRGAPEVAESGGPPAMGRWAGGASPPLVTAIKRIIYLHKMKLKNTLDSQPSKLIVVHISQSALSHLIVTM